ncbi:MAG: NADH-quinone oxidoreductase subunit NuoE [Flavobacteriaceae bacterium]
MSVRRLHHEQPSGFVFSRDNVAWAKKTIAKYPKGRQASAVIPLLWRGQEQEGWVSEPMIRTIADMLDMPYIRVLEVATFYTMFQLQPVGRKAHIQVCGTTPCMLRGAEELKAVCQRKIHHDPHHLSADGDFSWEEVECLGACVNAPMIQIVKDTYEDLTPETLEKLIDDIAAGNPVKPGPQNGRQYSAPIGGPTTLLEKVKPAKAARPKAATARPASPAAPNPASEVASNAKRASKGAGKRKPAGLAGTGGGKPDDLTESSRRASTTPAKPRGKGK